LNMMLEKLYCVSIQSRPKGRICTIYHMRTHTPLTATHHPEPSYALLCSYKAFTDDRYILYYSQWSRRQRSYGGVRPEFLYCQRQQAGVRWVKVCQHCRVLSKKRWVFVKLCKLESRFAVGQVWVRMIGIKLQDHEKGPYVLVSSWRMSVRGVTGQPTE